MRDEHNRNKLRREGGFDSEAVDHLYSIWQLCQRHDIPFEFDLVYDSIEFAHAVGETAGNGLASYTFEGYIRVHHPDKVQYFLDLYRQTFQ